MELSELAFRILSSDTLEGKLIKADLLTDDNPGEPIFWDEPSRPHILRFQQHTRKDRLPSLSMIKNNENIAKCLHRFAGHELLAVEIMAYALLAFPNAPKKFRKGLAHTLIEEQWHVTIYLKRLKELGVSFGDWPLYKHFWKETTYIKTPETYLATMSLTFEQANLDFAPAYGAAFLETGDNLSAELMKTIFEDEIRHVKFGSVWLKKMKPQALSLWQTYLEVKPEFLSPRRGKGTPFQRKARELAFLDEEWIDNILHLPG